MRIVLFVLFVGLLIGAWFFGWHYAAEMLKQRFTEIRAELKTTNQQLECINQRVEGFPFRIGIYCDNFFYSGQSTGIAVDSSAMRSAAQLYQPGQIVFEFDSPALVTIPTGESFTSEWDSLRSSLYVDLDGPERISLHGQKLRYTPQDPAFGSVKISDSQLHLRRVADNSVDVALSIQDFSLVDKTGEYNDGEFSISTIFTLEELYSDLLASKNLLQIARVKGLKGYIEKFQFSPKAGGMLEVSGPAEISPAGRISGKFAVKFSKLDEVANYAGQFFPNAKDAIITMAQAISVLSGGSKESSVSLKIVARNGQLYVGIFPVGSIPPLY